MGGPGRFRLRCLLSLLALLTSARVSSARMMLMLQVLCVLLVTGVMGNESRPSYIDCQNSVECGPGACCVLGAERYSVPTCQRMQAAGGSCRARGHESFNTSVGYPDGAYLELINVYWLFCQCGEGLQCDKPSSTCQPI